MIFVTVGTHEQPFNRLIKKVDQLIGDGSINDDVFMQIGYSTYKPQNCKWSDFISYSDMTKYMRMSDIVITHGGPATFMHSLSMGKKTIVVPRQEKFHEHVNNHQFEFANKVSNIGYKIHVVDDIDQLLGALNSKSSSINRINSNNARFVNKLEYQIQNL
ncbi:PssE/Cps14G family polysaccharide biosynthesis glycosyltransferase [Companilactobacillus insicii]|uniref:PssE/Cps14G family polysaccharide biosynthesis glycosyltransferase n=1 Tax=Companilactobacillus insicii TaxID=1732567 RepID=UPI000F76C805|nr:PssE/Cps14G family polysaccharide biosynthesis glycosyltransferase [Companilactobacillus insicii]